MGGVISSRTPEGSPNRCPVCGAEVRIEPSRPSGDAPCPSCGHLLWFISRKGSTRFWDRDEYPERVRRWVEMLFEAEDHSDSLDVFEFVMETEEEFDIDLPSSVSLTTQSPADLAEHLLTSPPNLENDPS